MDVCTVEDDVTCLKIGMLTLHSQAMICLFIGLDKGALICYTFGNIGTHF